MRFTEEQVDQMVALYESGMSLRAVAKEFKSRNDLISRHLRDRGVAIRGEGGPARISAERVAGWAEQYRDGLTCREIARLDGTSHYVTVGKKLREAGVLIEHAGRRRKRIFTPEEQGLMRERAAGGASSTEIAAELKAGISVVRRVMASLGILSGAPRGVSHNAWKGGVVKHGAYLAEKVSDDDPMASMRMRNGYVPQHRLVMARSLGRPLTRKETVHHRDGDRHHNAIENLELRRGAHGKHQALVCFDCGSHNIGAVA